MLYVVKAVFIISFANTTDAFIVTLIGDTKEGRGCRTHYFVHILTGNIFPLARRIFWSNVGFYRIVVVLIASKQVHLRLMVIMSNRILSSIQSSNCVLTNNSTHIRINE